MFLLAPVGSWIKRRAGELGSLDVAVTLVVVGPWLVIARYGSPPVPPTARGFHRGGAVPPLPVPAGVPAGGPAARLCRAATVGTAALVVASIALTTPGAISRSAFCWSATPTFIDDAPGRVWDWSHPQLFRPVRRLADGVSPRNVLIGACAVA